jgi:PLP dependent protein
LSAEMQKQNKQVPCFIQVNIGDEPQKSGIAMADLPAFLKLCRDECGLNIIGLMCIPPVDQEAGFYFALMQKLAHENGLKSLSMGMSDDFETAITFGATHIRIGSAFFGARA